MSKFHSMVSRREFMRALGLTGAGLGAAAVVAPAFHDVDELLSAPISGHKRPWWVKERDLFDPTTEVDWDAVKRFDRRLNGQTRYTWSKWPEFWARYQQADALRAPIRKRRLANQEPGYDLKYQALSAGNGTNQSNVPWNYAGISTTSKRSATPAELGLPKWTGTPEEAARLVRAATRFFGMSFVGFAELDSTWRDKLIVTHTTEGAEIDWGTAFHPSECRAYVYEDVPKAYEDEHVGKYVIPTKPISLISMAVTGAREARKCPSMISDGNRIPSENFHGAVQARLYNFLRTLGDYQLFGLGGHQEMASNTGCVDILTGIAENSRQNNFNVTPEMGPHYNPFHLMTDLPIAPTNPIDAGMFKFCAACGKCADFCPGPEGTISKAKAPSWDIPSKDGMVMQWHNPGVKNFWADSLECRDTRTKNDGCGVNGGGGRICYAVCVWGEDKAALAHNVVRATVSTTPLFNNFFAAMHDTFGYTVHDPDAWWDMSLPAFGMDTTVGAGKGGYYSH